MSVRLFVAVDLPGDVRAGLASALETLRTALRHAGMEDVFRWVAIENLHVTLRFLGNLDADAAARVVAAMRDPIARDAASIELAGLGTFPPRGRPRVLKVGVGAGVEFLRQLRDDVDARLAPLCRWEADSRPFAPHLTVARGRDGAKFHPVDFFRVLQEADWPARTFAVDRVTLFRSRTLPSGPEYTILAQAACAGRGAGRGGPAVEG